MVWSVIFYLRYTETERYQVASKMVTTLLKGSLIELLIAIPSHLIVSRRPGCFVGLLTAAGIAGGLSVMLWCFGPSIVLVCLHNEYKKQAGGPV